MGTSKSNEWTAGAELFSGRPDPVWVVSTETVTWLLNRWTGLDTVDEEPEPPLLGYRGVTLSDPNGPVWRAYGGVVTRSSCAIERRADIGRVWERAILETAPPNTLPVIDLGG
jgi:hypothetical protein